MNKKILIYFSLFLLAASVDAQECIVNVDSLKGEYSGDCSKGKAHGKGAAKGADTYTGDFKNGYPDGKGKYIWKNGNWYDGSWKKGLFDGEGALYKISADSVIITKGFWQKGKYIGKYESPYKVNSQSNAVTGVDIKKNNNELHDITIMVKSLSRASTVQGGGLLPKYRLTDIQIGEGKYDLQIPDERSSPYSNKYQLQRVSFPFRATLVFELVGGSMPQKNNVSVEILEDGSWFIQVNIDV